jgi:hypothetical protein
MIFECRSDIISTAFLLQAVLKICRSSVCAFVSRIWSNSPLRIILIDSSVNTLAKQDLYGASPSNNEENLEKKDLKYVRQSMYRERKKLQPAQSKNQAEFLLMEHINVVLSISSNYIRYMVLRMVITFHWSSVCYHRNQKPVTGKCFHYSMTAARDSTLICVLKKFIEILKIGCM